MIEPMGNISVKLKDVELAIEHLKLLEVETGFSDWVWEGYMYVLYLDCGQVVARLDAGFWLCWLQISVKGSSERFHTVQHESLREAYQGMVDWLGKNARHWQAWLAVQGASKHHNNTEAEQRQVEACEKK